MPSPASSSGLSRRRLLGLGGGVALTALAGCTLPATEPSASESARCVPRDTLDAHRSLAGTPLVYEPTGKQATFWFEPGFRTQLETWADTFADTWGRTAQWRTYGTWTDGGSACDSWHNSGRAFDLASVRLRDGSTVSCRYDRWRSGKSAELRQSRRAYWILAAGLHRHFAYVLTYLYNDDHANHIHVDNGRSGSGPPRFSTRSRVQVQAVQAIASYLWDDPVELTGRWDSSTRRASERILTRIGSSGSITDGDPQWQAFLVASAARGAR
jgi:hypothetical protein